MGIIKEKKKELMVEALHMAEDCVYKWRIGRSSLTPVDVEAIIGPIACEFYRELIHDYYKEDKMGTFSGTEERITY